MLRALLIFVFFAFLDRFHHTVGEANVPSHFVPTLFSKKNPPVIVVAGEYGRYSNQLIAVSNLLRISEKISIREIVLPPFGQAQDPPSTFLDLQKWNKTKTRLSEAKININESSRIMFVCDEHCVFSSDSMNNFKENVEFDVINIGLQFRRMDRAVSVMRKLYNRDINELLRIMSLYDVVVIHAKAAFGLHATLLRYQNVTQLPPDLYLPNPIFPLYNKEVYDVSNMVLQGLSTTTTNSPIYCAHLRRGDLKYHYPLNFILAQIRRWYSKVNSDSPLILFTDAEDEESARIKEAFPNAAINIPENLIQGKSESFHISVIQLTATMADHFLGYKKSSFANVISLNRRSLGKDSQWLI